jgi:hypothetical protein
VSPQSSASFGVGFSLDSDRQFLTARAADATGCPLHSLRSRVAVFPAKEAVHRRLVPLGLGEGVSSETQTEKEN